MADEPEAIETSETIKTRRAIIFQLCRSVPDIFIIEEYITILERSMGSKAYDSVNPELHAGKSILGVMNDPENQKPEKKAAIDFLKKRLKKLYLDEVAADKKEKANRPHTSKISNDLWTHLKDGDKKQPPAAGR